MLASLGIVLFLPLFFLFSFLIWVEDGHPIFYKQVKIGKNGKEFRILKFRSMGVDSEEIPANSLKGGVSRIKITKIGKFLRATAMDELPQLINILKGDMSFVGPRPVMPVEVQTFDPKGFSMRSSVRPGLTGLAQICGHKYISSAEKLQYDIAYINHFFLWLDIKIISYSIIITLGQMWETENRKIKYRLTV